VGGQDDDQDVPQELTHPEVLGVHVQLVTVQFAQLGKALLDVVQVLYSLPKGAQHFLAVGADHGVANDGGGTGEVPKGRKEPLGPGVDDQQPGFGPTFGHIDLAPEAGDELVTASGWGLNLWRRSSEIGSDVKELTAFTWPCFQTLDGALVPALLGIHREQLQASSAPN
uniref:Uncharacterized protein n=1 Tax=Gallus gallus TaxID=9031 RepID=A0A8V0XJ44_CHICK